MAARESATDRRSSHDPIWSPCSIDTALQEREATGRPIRVGMVGAGATGRAIALQLGTPVPGIRLVAIANRTPEHGERAFREAGITEWSRAEICSARRKRRSPAGLPVLTDDPSVLTACDAIDIIVEVTGTVEPAARVVLEAFDHGKHVVLVNAELDSLLGPILKAKADEAGVVVTHTDGDEPGVAMTLLRYLRSLGLRPVAAGNIKGMVDYYRNPETQRAFAEKNDQDARKVTSFADATKLSMETTVLANATGFHAGRRGMYGPACGYVREMANLLPADQMLETGLVDYALGAAPHTGALRHRSRGIAAQEGSTRVLQARRRPVLRLLHAVSSAAHPDRLDHRPSGHPSRSDRRPHRRPGLRSGDRRQARSESRRAPRRCRRILRLWADRQRRCSSRHGSPADRPLGRLRVAPRCFEGRVLSFDDVDAPR